MLPALMTWPSPRTLLLTVLAALSALTFAGCGETGIEVAKKDPTSEGARIFNQRCGGCHTFDAAGTEGSATQVNGREYKDGPNFNQRKEKYEDVLYAIRNGGFSSGPMPQNIATGRQAELVACFVASYSGKEASREPQPGTAPPTGSGDDDCKQQLASK
jgi:mono/diheme cytochrome c family protein